MKTKNNLIILLVLSLLVNVIFIAGNNIKVSGNTLNASVLSWLGFTPPQPDGLQDYKKSIYPCYMNDDVYVPYSTFKQDGGFITKTEIEAAFRDNPNVNGISYYYAVDNSSSEPMFGSRLFIIFKGDQKVTGSGKPQIVNLNTPYHNSDMLCPVDCPE